MLKRLACVFLMFAMLAVNFSRLFIYAGFELNKKYIISKVCENRDRPWMHCNGRCYLMKKIKAAQEKQAGEERESQKNLFQEAFFTSNPDFKFFSTVLQIISTPHNAIILPLAANSLFRPPRLV